MLDQVLDRLQMALSGSEIERCTAIMGGQIDGCLMLDQVLDRLQMAVSGSEIERGSVITHGWIGSCDVGICSVGLQ